MRCTLCPTDVGEVERLCPDCLAVVAKYRIRKTPAKEFKPRPVHVYKYMQGDQHIEDYREDQRI